LKETAFKKIQKKITLTSLWI